MTSSSFCRDKMANEMARGQSHLLVTAEINRLLNTLYALEALSVLNGRAISAGGQTQIVPLKVVSTSVSFIQRVRFKNKNALAVP